MTKEIIIEAFENVVRTYKFYDELLQVINQEKEKECIAFDKWKFINNIPSEQNASASYKLYLKEITK